jgi:hypothetical protein
MGVPPDGILMRLSFMAPGVLRYDGTTGPCYVFVWEVQYPAFGPDNLYVSGPWCTALRRSDWVTACRAEAEHSFAAGDDGPMLRTKRGPVRDIQCETFSLRRNNRSLNQHCYCRRSFLRPMYSGHLSAQIETFTSSVTIALSIDTTERQGRSSILMALVGEVL